MKSTSSKNFLKYGDSIIISSCNTNGMGLIEKHSEAIQSKPYSEHFLMARSRQESKVKVIRRSEIDGIEGELPLHLFPNMRQLIFKVEPLKDYSNLIEIRNSKSSEPRYNLLQRRLKAETERNRLHDEEMRGEPIRFGDEIQLYHEFTESYVSVSSSKLPGKNSYHLSLTQEGSEKIQFLLGSPLTQQKTGLKILKDEPISLVNLHNQMQISLPYIDQNQPFISVKKSRTEMADNLTRIPEFDDQDLTKLPDIRSTSLTEMNDLFGIGNALAFSISHKSKVTYVETELELVHTDLKFLQVPIHHSSNPLELRFGDYVRIISKGSAIGEDGVFFTDSNHKSTFPRVMVKSLTQEFASARNSLEAVFEIVPESMDEWGQVVDYKNYNNKKLFLRHYLSGGFLRFVDAEDRTINISGLEVSQTLQEFLLSFKERKIEVMKQRELESKKQKKQKKEKLDYSIKDEVESFMAKNLLTFVREASGAEDHTLDAYNLFQIRNPNSKVNESLTISTRDYHENKRDVPPREAKAFFKRGFYKMCKKDELFVHQVHFEKKASDTFFFEMVPMNEIYKSTEMMVTISPFLMLLRNSRLSDKMIVDAEYSVDQLMKLCARDVASKVHKDKFMSELNQGYLRELQIMSFIIRNIYLHCYYNLNNMPSSGEGFYILLNTCIDLLCKCCDSNLLNCYFIYQWEELFSKIILMEVGIKQKIVSARGVSRSTRDFGSRPATCKLNIDKVLEIVLRITNFSKFLMEKVTTRLISNLDYESFDSKSINYLNAIYQAPVNHRRNVKIVDSILDWIINEQVIRKVFRPIQKTGLEGEISLCISAGRQIPLKELAKQTSMLDFMSSNIQLANSLCIGYPNVFRPFYEKYLITKEVCMSVMLMDNLQDTLKSSFMELFTNCFIASEYMTVSEKEFPFMIRVPDGMNVEIRTDNFDGNDKGAMGDKKQIIQSKKKKKSYEFEPLKSKKSSSSQMRDERLTQIKSDFTIRLSQQQLHLSEFLKNTNFGGAQFTSGHINLIDFAMIYLINPTSFSDVEPHYIKALLGMLEMIIKKDLVNEQYAQAFQVVIINFMKNLLSSEGSSSVGSLSGIAEKLYRNKGLKQIVNNQKKLKGMSFVGQSTTKIDFRDVSHMVNQTDPSKASPEDISNMNIMPTKQQELMPTVFEFLQLLNNYLFDGRLRSITKENEAAACFDLSKVRRSRGMQKVKVVEELQTTRIDFMNLSSKTYPQPSSHVTFLLLDLATRTKTQVSKQAMHLLVSLYQERARYLRVFSQLVFVQKDEMFRSLYVRTLEVKQNLFEVYVKIQEINDPENQTQTSKKQFCELSDALNDLLEGIVIAIPRTKRESILTKQVSELTDYIPQITPLKGGKFFTEETPSGGWYQNVFNEVILCMENFDLKQKLFRETGIITMVFQILELAWMDYFDYIKNFTREGQRTMFDKEIIMGKTPSRTGTRQQRRVPINYLRNEIALKCLLVLIYCCKKNNQNQELILEKLKPVLAELKDLFFDNMGSNILKYYMLLLQSVYEGNLSLLLNSVEEDIDVTEHLSENFASIYKLDYEGGLYTLKTLFALTRYEGTVISQNMDYITDVIQKENYEKTDISKKVVYIGCFFNQILTKIIPTLTIQTHPISFLSSKIRKKGSRGEEHLMVEVPKVITFATEFLKLVNSTVEDDNSYLITLQSVTAMLCPENRWWLFRAELYRYVMLNYLEKDLEDNDSELLEAIIKKHAVEDLHAADLEIDDYELKKSSILFVDKIASFPSSKLTGDQETIVGKEGFMEFQDSIKLYVSWGLLPLLSKYATKMINSNAVKAKFMVESLMKDIERGPEGLDGSGSNHSFGNKDGIKQSIVIKQASIVKEGDIAKNDEGSSAQKKKQATKSQTLRRKTTITDTKNFRGDVLQRQRTEMNRTVLSNYKKLLKEKSRIFKTSMKARTPFENTELYAMKDSLYFNFWLEDEFTLDTEGNPRLVRLNFAGDFNPPWIDRLCDQAAQENMDQLAMLIIGTKSEAEINGGATSTSSNMPGARGKKRSKRKKAYIKRQGDAKFKQIIKAILDILQSSETEELYRNNCIMILDALVRNSDSLGIPIRKLLLEMGALELIITSIIRFNGDPEDCRHFIILAVNILASEEDGRQVQQVFYDYMVQDRENKFAEAMGGLLKKTFLKFHQKEELRLIIQQEVQQEHAVFRSKRRKKAIPKSQRLLISEKEEKVLGIGAESEEVMEDLINCMECLRLLCENHNSDLQNFLREQTDKDDQDVSRVNSVNFIQLSSFMLMKYKSIVNEFNIDFANKLFELLIEMLQGPCKGNQRDVCRENLLEQIEDLFLNFQNPEKISITVEQQTEVTQNIIIFQQALLEGTHDSSVISKAGIHVDQESYLKRLIYIYKLFYSQFSNNLSGFNNILGNQDDQVQYKIDVLDEETGKKTGKKKYNPMIIEGIQIVIILKMLCDLELNFQKTLTKTISKLIQDYKEQQEELNENRTLQNEQAGAGGDNDGKKGKDEASEISDISQFYNFFEEKVGKIEIMNENKKLQKIYFPKLLITTFLSNYVKTKFMDNVSRENANEKTSELLEKYQDFYDEMIHYQKLDSQGNKIKIGIFSYLKILALFLILIVNVVLLFTGGEVEEPQFTGRTLTDQVLYIICLVVLCIYASIFVLWLILNSWLDLNKTKRKVQAQLEAINHMKLGFKRSLSVFFYFWNFASSFLFDTYLFDLILNTFLALMGIFYNKYFLSFMLLDIVGRSDILINVIRSVTQNFGQFSMTALLGVIVIYIFSSITYFSTLRTTMNYLDANDGDDVDPDSLDYYKLEMCSSLTHCFLTILNFGMRAGGGIGETLAYPYFDVNPGKYIMRFFFDIIFFILINTIYLDILFGIIIDTFEELRNEKEERDFDKNFRCFICSIEKIEFSKLGKDFNHHIAHEHNPWDYIFFLVYLSEKDSDDFNGTESYINDKAQNTEISWFPIGHALSLEGLQDQKEEDLEYKFEQLLKITRRKWVSAFKEQKELNLNKQSSNF